MDITPRISTPLSREFYLAYLNSAEWRIKRSQALRRANWRCQTVDCSAKRNLQVHHLTYARLGCEWDSDLIVLCQDCHEGHHVLDMAESNHNKIFLKIAAETLRKDPWASIADLASDVKSTCAKLKIDYDAHQVDKALHLLTGKSRLREFKAVTANEARTTNFAGGLSHNESRELLSRLGLRSKIKEMPQSYGQIDIYAEVYERESFDYDRY